jgi:hypothetical protein
VQLLLRQPHAVVTEEKGGRAAVLLLDELHPHRARVGGLQVPPGPDGVGGVLQQLAHEHARRAVEVVGEEVDDPPEIDLEAMVHGRRSL